MNAAIKLERPHRQEATSGGVATQNIENREQGTVGTDQYQLSTVGQVMDNSDVEVETLASIQNNGEHDYAQWAVENAKNVTVGNNNSTASLQGVPTTRLEEMGLCEFDKKNNEVPSHADHADLEVHLRISNRRKSNNALSRDHSIMSASNEYTDHEEKDKIDELDSISTSKRIPLWDCSKSLSVDIHALWLVGGDFNIILKREERLYGAMPHSGSMEDFVATLVDYGLVDGGFEGNPYTWTNSWMFKRLDQSEQCDMTRFNYSLIPTIVFTSDNAGLCALPSMQELKQAVFGMDKNSVVGLDGFSSYFYQQCWDILADDLLAAVLNFFKGAKLPCGITSTTLVLLPKKKYGRWRDSARPHRCPSGDTNAYKEISRIT
ncbi:Uncharacterized protein TCM_036457 [Theobroma cacao]|uniref:Uncharacterized protein n=1 Tax=Theobroma cacao TaxID=3641 RepID=A0A061FS08_THECC|nr:Uncharacterized protein TCM_036457 [Theobroma cacao]